MKKKIARNVAIVSAVFFVTFAIMIVTNYFQVKDATPLQTEVMETLRSINDVNSDNVDLQAQIRELDLLARNAYFVRADHLKVGVYILLGMLIIMLACLHYYFDDIKDLPEEQIDMIDEWAIKTKARKYILWSSGALAAIALLFVFLTSPFMQDVKKKSAENVQVVEATSADDEFVSDDYFDEYAAAGITNNSTVVEEEKTEVASSSDQTNDEQQQTVQPVAVPRVTSNSFRGNYSTGVSSARNLPTSWNLTNMTNVAWKQETPLQGMNSPIINGNKIFFSGADEQKREVYCYDLNTGERLWVLSATGILGSPAQSPSVQQDTGLAASTMSTNGKQVCAIFANGDIICADMDGNKLWAKNLGVPENHYGYASSLIMYGDAVIVQYDNSNSPKVMALDATTGNVKWSKDRDQKITWSSPIIASVNNTPQLVLMGNPSMRAYNPNTGDQLWSVNFLTGEVGASPCAAGGIIYGANEYSKLVAVNGADGSILWESTEYLPECSSPVATTENLYLATSYGIVVCFDAQTGELKKEHELSEQEKIE